MAAPSCPSVPIPAQPAGLSAVASCAFHGRAAGLQPGDRHPEGRAGDVVEPGGVEEVHRLRVTAVLAADADLELGAGLAALLDSDLDQPSDALGVESLERADPEDAEVDVAPEERAFDVVAGERPAHLCQVVGAEGEELRRLCDL